MNCLFQTPEIVLVGKEGTSKSIFIEAFLGHSLFKEGKLKNLLFMNQISEK